MQLTPEQYDIINAAGNIKINAVAGSGKTTTIIEYAKTRPPHSRILYLAFNKSVKLEAQRKFAEKGLAHVRVETAHSLAYKHIVFRKGYKVRAHGYTSNDIVELLQLRGNGEKHAEYILANHINKFITYFCNSDCQKVQDLNYPDTVSDHKARTFVNTCYKELEKQTRLLLSKMDKGEVEVIHDFYLKKFQLSQPVLSYDYILFDEGQDASPVMLDIFLKQAACKVIVGDTHQQIYGWRHAVNALEKSDFKTCQLTTSFRFGQPIADLAMKVLQWKKHLGTGPQCSIVGKGGNSSIGSKAVIARTNLGLLLKAIQYVTEKKKVKNLYFEGNINSYTYADEGASLYDVLHLYNGRYRRIKDRLIRGMKSLGELEEYVEKTEDAQLGMMIEIVKEYGNEIPGIINAIKAKHIGNDEKEQAEMIFSTVHRCKGMEYDAVQLVNDFIMEEKLIKIQKEKHDTINTAKLHEEINLLYVALTRAKSCIYLPEALLPEAYPNTEQIHILKEPGKNNAQQPVPPVQVATAAKTSPGDHSGYGAIRQQHPGAYSPWTQEQDQELTAMYCEGVSLYKLSKHFGRTTGAILARIKKLELGEAYG